MVNFLYFEAEMSRQGGVSFFWGGEDVCFLNSEKVRYLGGYSSLVSQNRDRKQMQF